MGRRGDGEEFGGVTRKYVQNEKSNNRLSSPKKVVQLKTSLAKTGKKCVLNREKQHNNENTNNLTQREGERQKRRNPQMKIDNSKDGILLFCYLPLSDYRKLRTLFDPFFSRKQFVFGGCCFSFRSLIYFRRKRGNYAGMSDFGRKKMDQSF